MRRFLRKSAYVIGGLAFAYMMLGTFAFLVQRETWLIVGCQRNWTLLRPRKPKRLGVVEAPSEG